MDIAIIGAGNVGRALATSFTRAGHSVVITSHDPEDAGAVADGHAAPGSPRRTPSRRGCRGRHPRDAVLQRRRHRRGGHRRDARQDRGGRHQPDVVRRGRSGDRHEHRRTPKSSQSSCRRRVVKAFNTLFASNQSDPVTEGVQLDGFVAGDDADAKRHGPRARRVDRPPPGRRRAARPLAPARRHGVPQHRGQHRRGWWLDSRAGSSSAHRPRWPSPPDTSPAGARHSQWT